MVLQFHLLLLHVVAAFPAELCIALQAAADRSDGLALGDGPGHGTANLNLLLLLLVQLRAAGDAVDEQLLAVLGAQVIRETRARIS